MFGYKLVDSNLGSIFAPEPYRVIYSLNAWVYMPLYVYTYFLEADNMRRKIFSARLFECEYVKTTIENHFKNFDYADCVRLLREI